MSPLQLLSFVPMAMGARIRLIERRAIRRLHEAGANRAERAILLEQGGPLRQFVYGRLLGAGALAAAGDDRYYVNEAAYEAFRRRRRTRAAVILAALIVGVALLYVQGAFS